MRPCLSNVPHELGSLVLTSLEGGDLLYTVITTYSKARNDDRVTIAAGTRRNQLRHLYHRLFLCNQLVTQFVATAAVLMGFLSSFTSIGLGNSQSGTSVRKDLHNQNTNVCFLRFLTSGVVSRLIIGVYQAMWTRTNQNTGDEGNWRQALHELQGLMSQYDEATNEMVKNGLARRIIEVMRRLSSIHPDQAVRSHWRDWADAFSNADERGKKDLLADVKKGIVILLTTPFLLVGGVLFAAGSLLYGAGTLAKGVGRLLTGGIFD